MIKKEEGILDKEGANDGKIDDSKEDVEMKDGEAKAKETKVEKKKEKKDEHKEEVKKVEDDEEMKSGVDEWGVPKDIGKDDMPHQEGPNGAYNNPFPVNEEDYQNTSKWYDRKEDGEDLEKEDDDERKDEEKDPWELKDPDAITAAEIDA